MSNVYYTFNQKCDFHPYTIEDILSIIKQHSPVQIVIDSNVCWDSNYDTETYDNALKEFYHKQAAELWISTIDKNHSIIKISTWETDS